MIQIKVKFLNDNDKEYTRFLKTQKLIRDIDEIHIIDQNKKLLFSNIDDLSKYPSYRGALKLVLDDDRPLKLLMYLKIFLQLYRLGF